MDRYIISYRNRDRGDFSLDLMEQQIPCTERAAAEQFNYLRDQMGDRFEFRVEKLDGYFNSFEDVTSRIESLADEMLTEAEIEALLDYEHERIERAMLHV